MGRESLLERIVRCFVDPEHKPYPRALIDYWRLGDSRYLVAGGIEDQPVRYLAAGYAGKIYWLLEQEAEATEQLPIEQRVKGADLTLLIETIRPLRKRIVQEVAGRGRS